MQTAHAHGTIHRDLKPANVMIDKAGEPVVMDFGLARRAAWTDDPAATARRVGRRRAHPAGSVLGTPAYMPPEQARGDVAAIGPRSDVYALGVILYELLTGRRPFAADDTADLIRQIETEPPPPPTDFYPWIDRGVEAACLRALAKDPADRFQSMGEFERALHEAVEPELTVVVPPPLPKPARPRRKKRWWVKPAWVAGLTLLFLTVCVAAPTLAVWSLINLVMNKAKDFTDAHAQSEAEWDAITGFWPAPAADVAPETLLPPTFGDGRFRLRAADQAPADAELGITLAGRRGIYDGPDGEVEVRVYRCPEDRAKAIQQSVYAFAQTRLHDAAAADPASKRKKAVYAQQDTGRRVVTFGLHDDLSQNQEYGKLWYGGGWLYWFRTTQPLAIETFPSKFLMEVGKRASGKK